MTISRTILSSIRREWLLMAAIVAVLSVGSSAKVEAATLTLLVKDAGGDSLPCRIHFQDKNGKPQRPDGLPFFRDHFVCPGRAVLELPAGKYSFAIERGPEYEGIDGEIELADNDRREVTFTLKRIADLAKLGWHAGDLHVHRPVEDIRLLMQAEDLHVAPVITWWNNRNLWKDKPIPERLLQRFDSNRLYDVMAGEDEREGGALLFFHLKKPLEITGSSREFPSPMKFVAEARRHKKIWIDIEKPFWWDVPVWLASGQVDSIGLANNHMCRSRMYEDEAWGRPRDSKRLPAPRGNGYWTQEIYYDTLNCGLRIPPSAGSASGVLPNPVGYNRVYVHTGKQLSYDGWWDGLKAGRSFVTNGPLLICRANGELPGHVFAADPGKEVEIQFDVSLVTGDHVTAFEIIRDGKIVRRVPIEKGNEKGEFGTLKFRESGWFLVRAIADNPRTFRFASTAPFYVEVGKQKRRISRKSAKFFLDWVDERIARVEKNVTDAGQREEVIAHHRSARTFWQKRLEAATAE